MIFPCLQQVADSQIKGVVARRWDVARAGGVIHHAKPVIVSIPATCICRGDGEQPLHRLSSSVPYRFLP